MNHTDVPAVLMGEAAQSYVRLQWLKFGVELLVVALILGAIFVIWYAFREAIKRGLPDG